MKKLLYLLPIIASLCACNSDSGMDNDDLYYKNATSTAIKLDTRSQEMVGQTNEMSWNLLRQSLTDERNSLLSPFSLSACLAMLDNGATGETEAEIRKFLGFENYSQEEFNSIYKSLLQGLPKVDTSVKFTAANSFWFQAEYRPKAAFSKSMSENFDAGIFNVDFKQSATLGEINSWCSEKTNKLIPNFLKQLDPETKAMLLNAIYFKGAWAVEFDKKQTKEQKFQLRTGETVSAKFMRRNSEELAFDNDAVSIVSLPLGKFKKFRTFFVLPKQGKSMAEAADAAQKAFGDQRTNTPSEFSTFMVDMEIPKFKFENNKLLNETLKAMGLGHLFAEDADYSNIFEDLPLQLSFIRQACVFSVNEKEVEAAATTAAGLNYATALPTKNLEFKLDRPFLYGLYEQTSGTILFLGAMENPALTKDED